MYIPKDVRLTFRLPVGIKVQVDAEVRAQNKGKRKKDRVSVNQCLVIATRDWLEGRRPGCTDAPQVGIPFDEEESW